MVALIQIVAGGQSGAERAALDWAIANCVPHRGWCPKGRKADDGTLPARYELTETPRPTYAQRAEWNARDSDATVIFTIGNILNSDFRQSVVFALKHGKPVLHVSRTGGLSPAHETFADFVKQHSVKRLNIAGSKASTEPEVGAFVRETLERTWPPLRLLTTPDGHHLRAAQGWVELGNPLEAKEEVEQIAPQFHGHPDVLEVRWHLQAHAKKWVDCVDLANAVIKLDPERSEGWIHRSFALHELKRTQEALDQLVPVADRFPEVWTVPYNLACYCAQLGRLKQAKSWLNKALAIEPEKARQAGRDYPDLKPLHKSMARTFRKDTE